MAFIRSRFDSYSGASLDVLKEKVAFDATLACRIVGQDDFVGRRFGECCTVRTMVADGHRYGSEARRQGPHNVLAAQERCNEESSTAQGLYRVKDCRRPLVPFRALE
jgi:hypothetical protein